MTSNESKKFKSIKTDAENIRNAKKNYLEKVNSKNRDIDKKDFKFTPDSHTFCCMELKAVLSSYTGSHGSSSCSILFSISNKDEINKAFSIFLNRNESIVLEELENILDELKKYIKKNWKNN